MFSFFRGKMKDSLKPVVFCFTLIFLLCACQEGDTGKKGGTTNKPPSGSLGTDQSPDDLLSGPDEDSSIFSFHRNYKGCMFDFDDLTRILETFQARGLAFALAIVTEDQLIYERYFGGFTGDTVVPLASASKIPTSTIIMQLVDAGLIGLDDRVNQYLDFWPADKEEITLRNLLSHTSGLPGQAFCFFNPDTTLDACAREIAEMNLLGPTGQGFTYGGTGLQVAGRIAEVVTGQRWHDLYQTWMAQPCELDTMYYGWETENPLLASGINTNLVEFTHILQLHVGLGMYKGTRLLTENAVKEMQKNHLAGVTLSYRYGLGWWIMPHPLMEPASNFHDAGGLGSIPWIDINRKYGAFLMMHDSLYTGWEIQKAIQPFIEEQFDNCP